jgi:hypothetical protein
MAGGKLAVGWGSSGFGWLGGRRSGRDCLGWDRPPAAGEEGLEAAPARKKAGGNTAGQRRGKQGSFFELAMGNGKVRGRIFLWNGSVRFGE